MTKITINLIDDYKAKIEYNQNGSIDVKSIKITPKLDAGDVTYGRDISVPMGETIVSEATILKYFENCKIKGKRLFDAFTAAILNDKLSG